MFLLRASCNLGSVNFLYANDRSKAPIAPQPAASVGVANPNKILPNAAKLKLQVELILKKIQSIHLSYSQLSCPQV